VGFVVAIAMLLTHYGGQTLHARLCGGGGCGSPNLAQAGGRNSSKLAETLESACTQLHSAACVTLVC